MGGKGRFSCRVTVTWVGKLPTYEEDSDIVGWLFRLIGIRVVRGPEEVRVDN